MEAPGEKLLIKLWETLAEKGFGGLLTPWQTIREGRARNEVRRQELLLLAQAETDVIEVRAGRMRVEADGSLRRLPNLGAQDGGTLSNSEVRIEPTLNLPQLLDSSNRFKAFQDARSEINSAKAIIFAEDALSDDQHEASEIPLHDDWLYTWRDYAGRVSESDLQQLWGQVLAGEVKSPGKYSIRTLEYLRGISKQEAEFISKLAPFVLEGIICREPSDFLESNGITFGLLLKLQELGLISGVEGIGSLSQGYTSMSKEEFLCVLRSNGKVLIIGHPDASKMCKVEAYILTTVGTQILSLGSFEANNDYLRKVGQEIVKKGFSVRLADWVQKTPSTGSYSNQEQIEVDI